jgi:hypothetical protein
MLHCMSPAGRESRTRWSVGYGSFNVIGRNSHNLHFLRALTTRLLMDADVVDNAIASVWLCLVAGGQSRRVKENVGRAVVGRDEAKST